MTKIQAAQKKLQELKFDGWLLYEFHGVNSLAIQFLEIPTELLMTRRCFYWIPVQGDPLKIVHQIESHNLDHLPGEKKTYSNWRDLHQHLKTVLNGKGKVAMEYSPMQAIPTVSKVDAGLVDLIRSFDIQVVSSAPFLQEFTCVWTPHQYKLHKEAAEILDNTVHIVWNHLKMSLEQGKTVTEYDIQQMILGKFRDHGCVTEGEPICGVNAHAADPHYIPTEKNHAPIQKGDLVLIDLWCKKDLPEGVFADITRMGVAASKPTSKQQEIFSIVRRAQQTGTDWIASEHRQGKLALGAEVDHRVRRMIEESGYGPYFTHRTGHNINKENHGPGANIDGLETEDDRPLIPNTCFSIEPGIYLPGEFGVRLEYDVFMHEGGEIEVTVPPQDEYLTF
jgi:Xaa-Pro aminopeptidase